MAKNKRQYKRDASKIRENILNQKEEAREIIEESLGKAKEKNLKETKDRAEKQAFNKQSRKAKENIKDSSSNSKEEVILMGAPLKNVAELPVHDATNVKTSTPKESISPSEKSGKSVRIDFGDKVEHTTASKEELPKIKNKKNIPINGVREHISLGKIFIWFIAIFVAYLIAGQILNTFGPTTISILSLWPLLLIFIGLSLFKVKKRGATRLIAGFFIFLIFAASVALVFKSGNIVTINTTGEIVTEERGVDPFTIVNFEAVGDITFKLGDREAVVIRADGAVIDEVSTKVKNGELKIKYANSLWSLFLFDNTNVEVEVISRDIEKIVVAGKANAEVDGIEGKKLDFEIRGTGNADIKNVNLEELIVRLNGRNEIVKTSGKAIIEYVLIRGAGTYEGKELTSSKTIVRISGDSDAFINSSKEISALIEGRGNVIYQGGGVIKEQSVKGKGKVMTLSEYSSMEMDKEVEPLDEENDSDDSEDNDEMKASASEALGGAVVEDAEGFLKSLNSKLE